MDIDLLKKARMNSILLALTFGMQTAASLNKGELLGFIGLLATIFTAIDVYRFHKAIKGDK